MTTVDRGIWVLAYRTHQDRESRQNEVDRKIATTVEELNRVIDELSASGFFLNYETKAGRAIHSGTTAEYYLEGIFGDLF